MELLIATKNEGKVKEFVHILSEYGIKVKSLLDFENIPEVIEDGNTFEENAYKKAKEMSDYFNLPVLADDSGLEIDALNGEPGIFSARFAGVHGNHDANNDKVLRLLKEVPNAKRTARFVCVLAFVTPDNYEKVVRGETEGYIATERSGTKGFGYDPLFIMPQFNKTFAEMNKQEKAKVSHRGKAIRMIKDTVVDYYEKNNSR